MPKIFTVFFLFVFLNADGQINLNNGLQAYYPFSGNANEALGNGMNGVVNGGAQLTTDRFGNPNSAYFFDGIDDFIKIPNNPTINSQSAFTVTAFFQSNVTTVATVLGKIDDMNGVGTQYQVAVNFPPQPGVLFGVNQPNSNCAGTPVANFYVNSGGTINQNRWYCFATTFENGVMKLYLDGALISTTTASFQTITNCPTADVQIGSWWTGDPQRFRGKIDDVRFYNRALNVNEIASLCSNANPINCDQWLSTPAQNSFVNIGQLNVPGNKITVEAVFNRTAPYTNNQNDFTEGDLVSKHDGPPNVNYLLRPNHASITTSNGFFVTPDVCPIELNKTYHVAMVYDGATLKYYRNGFLLSQVAATGNLFQNSWAARIGRYQGTFPSNFIGYINEVKIWNVARTQAQIGANMYTTLQAPSTQTGLQAYYSFDNLINKQGNPAWNAVLSGAATINSINSSCAFVADSCRNINSDTLIVNKYSSVISFDKCKNSLIVQDATDFNVGDTVLMIQMKGAIIDSTNTASFGNITDYKNAGNYEFNYVKSKSANRIELLNSIIRQYDLPNGKMQLVRVPYYLNANFDKVLTCLPWDGSKGGILAINVRDTLRLSADINISNKGFRGGLPVQNSNFVCDIDSFYVVNSNGIFGAAKGESIVNSNRLYARGKLASGGGGGNSTNAGGAGGANAGNGGEGGKQLVSVGPGCNSNFTNGGVGGAKYVYSNATNKIFMGGGGGAGHENESLTTPAGNGGGIAIISAGFIRSGSNRVISVGATPSNIDGLNEDGRSGGGAGGSVLLNYSLLLEPLTVDVRGGNGDFSTAQAPTIGLHGPGGGGGGGIVWINKPVETSLTPNINGGQNGVNIYLSNNPWGATAGQTGLLLNNLNLPIATVPFKTNIDSVRINPTTNSCNSYNFSGLGYTNTNPITSWQWDFGDGSTASTQNTSHIYNTVGIFTVKLIVTDASGCKDSISRVVNSNTLNVSAGNDASYCSNIAVTHNLTGTGNGTTYNWQPASLLNDNTLANPTATIISTTKFYLTQTSASGCNAIDSVVITVNPLPVITTFADTSVCKNSVLILNVTGAQNYQWTPANAVSNPAISNPIFIGNSNQSMTVTGSSIAGCNASKSFNVAVKTLPIVTTIPDTTICTTQSIVLTTYGAQIYSWSPATNLSNPNVASPTFFGNTGNDYTVTGTASNGCSNTDIVRIGTRGAGVFNTPPNKSVCINGTVTLDGNNGNNVIYQWSTTSILSNINTINPTATPTVVGNNIYSVTITDVVCNNSSTFQVNVDAKPLPTVTATRANDLDCANTSTALMASGAMSYVWSPATSLNNPNISTPVASPSFNTDYTVIGTDINGCKNKGSVSVLVKGTVGRYDVPNTFTPNGDGINDCFGVRHWPRSTTFKLMIYDRYGNRVFETNSHLKCWDGRYKGQPANTGAYVYYITAQSNCGYITKKGSVVLLK